MKFNLLAAVSLLIFLSFWGQRATAQKHRGNPFDVFRGPSKTPSPPAPVPPAGTIADEAEAYWTQNDCLYPPQDFYPIFRTACEVEFDSKTFYAGICRSFYNTSKSICKLEEAGDDERQTMLSLSTIQAQIGDDDICDTLLGFRENDPTLFPHPSGDDEWFEPTYNLLFSASTCPSVCGLDGVHPICFGYLLNYNYIEDAMSRAAEAADAQTPPSESATPEMPADDNDDVATGDVTEEEGAAIGPDDFDVDAPGEAADEENSSEDKIEDLPVDEGIAISQAIGDLLASFNASDVFRPNPKLLNTRPSDAADYNYNYDDMQGTVIDLAHVSEEEEGVILSQVLESNPKLLENILEIGETFPVDDGSQINGDVFPVGRVLDIEQLGQQPNWDNFEGEALLLRQRIMTEGLDSLTRHDARQQLPMLSIIVLFASAMVVLSICVLYKVRKRIGLYVRHMRQRRRNNWNYERVLTAQPDEDEYYE